MLHAALVYYDRATNPPTPGIELAVAAWRSRIAGDPAAKPATLVESCAAELVTSRDAAQAACEVVEAERAKLVDAHNQRKAQAEEDAYQRRKAAAEAMQEAKLRRGR